MNMKFLRPKSKGDTVFCLCYPMRSSLKFPFIQISMKDMNLNNVSCIDMFKTNAEVNNYKGYMYRNVLQTNR